MKKVMRINEGTYLYYSPKEEVFYGGKEGTRFRAFVSNLKELIDFLKSVPVWDLYTTRFFVLKSGWLEVLD